MGTPATITIDQGLRSNERLGRHHTTRVARSSPNIWGLFPPADPALTHSAAAPPVEESLRQVPEPGTLALLGLGLCGVGASGPGRPARASRRGGPGVVASREAVRRMLSCLQMIAAEDLCGDEWAEWYRLTPQERWAHSQALWPAFLALGGRLDPEPDTDSPFFDADAWRAVPADGRPGVRVLRRGRV